MTTPPRDAAALADAIDPRAAAFDISRMPDKIMVHTADLIAASDLLRSLPMSGDEWLEKAARYHDDAADTVAAEHPGIQGSKSQKQRRRHHIESATAIRALKTTPTHGEKTG